ncbi:MAG: prepilin peptidase [Burkholderiaceae bacterium]
MLAACTAACAATAAKVFAASEVAFWLSDDAPSPPSLHPAPVHAALAACLAMVPLALLFRVPTLEEALVLGLWTGLLTSCALIDLRCRLLPDRLTLSLAFLGLATALMGLGPGIWSALAGGAFGYLLPWAVGRIMRRRAADPQGEGPEAIGRGDLALLGAMGLWVGFSGLPLVLVGASLVMLPVIAWGMLRFGWSRSTALPFGPGLCMAGIVVLPWVLTEGWVS